MAPPTGKFLRFTGLLWENMVFERAPGWETDTIERRPGEGDGEYLLQLLDGNGEELVRVAPDVDFYRKTTIGPAEMLWADIVAYIPLHPDTRELVFRRGDRVLHREGVAREPPRIEVGEVRRVGEGRIEVSWRAEQSEGAPLSFDLLYVLGRQRAFYVARGVRETSYVVDLAPYPGGSEAQIAVLASDGTRSDFAMSNPFEVEDKPPQVWIHRPAPEETLPADQPVSLAGQATDVAGATLSSEHLVWEVDGTEVDRGTDLAMATGLQPGRHEVILRYADPAGPPAEQRSTFTIAERSEMQEQFLQLKDQLQP
jgi:hypothetical protein